ncbi:hypothetical protein GGI23_001743, partial [Coemansia sp. RSA 2559]
VHATRVACLRPSSVSRTIIRLRHQQCDLYRTYGTRTSVRTARYTYRYSICRTTKALVGILSLRSAGAQCRLLRRFWKAWFLCLTNLISTLLPTLKREPCITPTGLRTRKGYGAVLTSRSTVS